MNRDFLERSLEDLDRELLAGDLTPDDHRRLREQYERRLRDDAPGPTAPRRRPGLVVLAAGFVVVVAVAAGLLLARSAGRREAGDTITGGDVAAAPAAPGAMVPPDLARCRALAGRDAIDCFTSYTDLHPNDPRGLTQFGLFAIAQGMESGSAELVDAGEGLVRRALEIDPDDVEARVYLAVVLERTGRGEQAAAECTRVAELEVRADLAPLVDLACT